MAPALPTHYTSPTTGMRLPFVLICIRALAAVYGVGAYRFYGFCLIFVGKLVIGNAYKAIVPGCGWANLMLL